MGSYMKVLLEVVDSPSCAKCKRAREMAEKVAASTKDVELHGRRIVELGILSTPAIAINGKVVFTSIPKEEELRRKIQEASI